MASVKHAGKAGASYLLSFLKWAAVGVGVGCIVGLAGVGFAYTMQLVTAARTAVPLLVLGLPLCGATIVFLYHRAGVRNSRGTNLVLLSVRSEEDIPLRMAPLIFIGTALTHLFGGSAGREGAALQLGGSIAQNLGKLLKMNKKELHVVTMAGMSACFTALFGTPLTATVFAMEVVSVGAMYYSALVPCATASVTAYAVATLCGLPPERFAITGIPEAFSPLTALRVGALAALAALVSILFCVTLKYTGKLYKKWFSNAYIKAAVGGVIIAALSLLLYALTGKFAFNGAGMDVVAAALDGQADGYAFLLKILFTALTLEAGFKGGEIVPTFYIGSTFGCFAGPFLGLPPSFSAALGLMSLFCGVTNCPITSIFLSLELFGGEGLLWYLLSAAVSYMLSGYFGLYSQQKILYSKELPEFIDATCK